MQKNIAEERNVSLELEDQTWFPKSLRAYQTDFLGALAKLLGIYTPAKNFLNKKISEKSTVVDLASGSGIPGLITARRNTTQMLFCDKFPNTKNVAYINRHPHCRYLDSAIDILEDELPKGDVYVMFNSLHHFNPTEIISILKEIKSNNSSAYLFEPISPNFVTFLKVGVATLLLPFFIVPFTKPFRWDRLIFTYLVPIGVFATFWDGMASVQKSYTIKKLNSMKESFEKSGLRTNTGILRGKFTALTYLELIP